MLCDLVSITNAVYLMAILTFTTTLNFNALRMSCTRRIQQIGYNASVKAIILNGYICSKQAILYNKYYFHFQKGKMCHA